MFQSQNPQRILAISVAEGGALVTFADGKTVFYHEEFLYKSREQKLNVFVADALTDAYQPSPVQERAMKRLPRI